MRECGVRCAVWLLLVASTLTACVMGSVVLDASGAAAQSAGPAVDVYVEGQMIERIVAGTGERVTVGYSSQGIGTSLAVGPDGTTYIGTDEGRIWLLPSTGGFPELYTDALGFVTGIDVSNEGDLYFVGNEGYQVSLIRNGSSTSEAVGPPECHGFEQPSYCFVRAPSGLAVDDAGNVYVSSRDDRQIVEFPAEGGPPRVIAGNIFAVDLAVDDDGYLYVRAVEEGEADRILKIGVDDSSQEVLLTGEPSLGSPAVDAGGNVYVTLPQSGRLMQISPSGTLVQLRDDLQGIYLVAVQSNAQPREGATLRQNIEGTRPEGTLILSQDCGVDPTCTVDLRSGVLSSDGTHFEAVGTLHPLTIIDTRDSDPRWIVSGALDGAFTSVGDSFSGDALGWTPFVLGDSPPGPTGYDQDVEPGPPLEPWDSPSLVEGHAVLMAAPPGRGLGHASGGVELRLLIPVGAAAGEYTARLSLTVS